MRRLTMVAIAAVFALALAVPAASSATTDIFMKIEGIGETTTGGGCLDCLPSSMGFRAEATCEICAALGKPTSGNMVIATTVSTSVSKPCKVRLLSGTIEIAWIDGSTSTGTLSGRFRGSRLKLAGAFSAGDPVYPGDPVKVLIDEYPPSPCVSGSSAFTGGLTIADG